MSFKTVTVVAAFHPTSLSEDYYARNLRGPSSCRDTSAAGLAVAHAEAVKRAAEWAGEWLAGEPNGNGLGFTAHASWGGGAGWDTEAGVTFTFAGVSPARVLDVLTFARALKTREAQEAVVVLVRDESFTLVD